MNKLNVFGFGYWPARHVFRNIKQFFKNCKYAWQRATKGYSDWDRWDLDVFYTELMIQSLKEFVDKAHGAPDPYFDHENDSIEPWKKYVYEIADHLDHSREESDYFTNKYDKIIEDPGFDKRTRSQRRYLLNCWRDQNEKNQKLRDQEFAKALDMIKEMHGAFWD